MTHVLLGGERKAIEMIGAFLADWGVTCGILGQDRDPAGVPLLECDVVILGCGPTLAEKSGDADDAWERSPERGRCSPASFSEVAPVLVVGNLSGHQTWSSKAWSVIPEPGPRGNNLREALEACCARTGELRSRIREMHLFNDYAQFLGHELRSPLTAVKTALEVLEGDLGGMIGGDPAAAPDDMRLKMVEIALRNIRRLHETVEWSQDLLEMSESRPQVRKRRLGLEEFLLGLSVEIPVEIDDDIREIYLRTDPEMLGKLLEQSIRVMEFCQQGQDLMLRFQAERGRLSMALSVEQGPGSTVSGRTDRTTDQETRSTNIRTHLLDPAQDGQQSQALELTRLAEFLISGSLLEALGASLAVTASGRQKTSLTLSIPLDEVQKRGDESRSAEPDLVCSSTAI